MIIKFFSKIIAKIGIKENREFSSEELCFLSKNTLSGCLVLTRSNWQLANFFIKGKYKHAMVFINKNNIVDSTVEFGSKKRDIMYLEKFSNYSIYRPSFEIEHNQLQHFGNLLANQKIKYDHSHKRGNKFYDCTEMVQRIYESSHKVVIPYKWPFYPERLIESGMFTEIFTK